MGHYLTEAESKAEDEKIARLTQERNELREAGQAVVDCFGVGADKTQLLAHLAYHIGRLAVVLNDERAAEALATNKET